MTDLPIELPLWRTIAEDVKSNADPSGRTGFAFWAKVLGKALLAPTVHVVVLYRLSHALAGRRITTPLAFALRSLAVIWGGTEIHPRATIGPGLCLVHSQKVIIAGGVRIGRDARICHGVSIGADPGRGSSDLTIRWPQLGDHVTIGMDAIIMGGVSVGDHAMIGAQALVLRDVPAHATVVGSPARVINSSHRDHPGPG